VDFTNLDSLLALGICHGKDQQEHQTLQSLWTWAAHNEKYKHLLKDFGLPSEQDNCTWREQLTSLLNAASHVDPADGSVHVAHSIVESLGHSYGSACENLSTACKLEPHNYVVWNELGCALEKHGKSELARIAYHQSLLLRPNSPQTWTNLAITHASLGEYEDAARFLVSSLLLSPSGTRSWQYLRSAALNLKDEKLIEAVKRQDLEMCAHLCNGVKVDALPLPEKTLPTPAHQILESMSL